MALQRFQGDGRYANEVVVQQHPIIMTDTDRNIRVVCSFEAGDRTVTLASTFARNGAYSGLDVTYVLIATQYHPTHFPKHSFFFFLIQTYFCNSER